jgi:transposase
MKAYSTDLRQKIIDTYHSQPISQRQLAQRFTVALSFIQKIINQNRTTGSVAPKPHQGGTKLKLTGEQLAVLAELVESNNDATLAELCVMLEEKIGVVVSIATMGRMTNRLNITVKKKLYIPTKNTAKGYKYSEPSFGKKFVTSRLKI